jgi:hypothetical protein
LTAYYKSFKNTTLTITSGITMKYIVVHAGARDWYRLAISLYENDRLSPFYGTDGSKPTIPCCSHTDFKPTEKQVENYKKALGLEQ